jgi:hypothetical protein
MLRIAGRTMLRIAGRSMLRIAGRTPHGFRELAALYPRVRLP